MKAHFGKFALIVVTSSLALGGCATTGSVKRAQARADQAFVEGQKGQADAARAQGSADAAGAAAQRAQGTADAAGSAAQGAGAAAQAAQTTANAAQANGEQITAISARLHKLEAAEWRRHHPKKAKHRHHPKPKPPVQTSEGQAKFHQ